MAAEKEKEATLRCTRVKREDDWGNGDKRVKKRSY